MNALTVIVTVIFAAAGSAAGIALPEGYTAEVLATDIEGADGLALSSSGVLFAASETGGRVVRILPDGTAETILEGLDHPEGLAADSAGGIWVCEDVWPGRLLHRSPDGEVSVLVDSLQYPEGVCLTLEGDILITQSSAEHNALPPFYSSVSRFTESGMEQLYSSLYLWSFSGVAVDSAGNVYVCNELSGYPLVEASVVRFDASTGEWSVFCRGRLACEGLCFQSGGGFPLMVAEEDTGEGSGRISSVSSDGSHEVFASGFGNIEDVAAGPSGELYVSEDTTGSIILIRKSREK